MFWFDRTFELIVGEAECDRGSVNLCYDRTINQVCSIAIIKPLINVKLILITDEVLSG